MGKFALFDAATDAPVDAAPVKGAGGRISTASGALLTYDIRAVYVSSRQLCPHRSDVVRTAISTCEATASAKAASAAKTKERKQDEAAVERPLRRYLAELKYITAIDAPLTIKHLDLFRQCNLASIWPIVYSKAADKATKVVACLACVNVLQQRLVRADGALAAVTCVHCSSSSAHADCVGCACGDWHCNVCVPMVLAQHRATCRRANEAMPTSECSCSARDC